MAVVETELGGKGALRWPLLLTPSKTTSSGRLPEDFIAVPISISSRDTSFSPTHDEWIAIDVQNSTTLSDLVLYALGNVAESAKKREIASLKSRLSDKIKSMYTALPHVRAVFLIRNEDHYEIQTYLDTRGRQSRDAVFDSELSILDEFPNVLIDFKVFLTADYPDADQFDGDVLVCIER